MEFFHNQALTVFIFVFIAASATGLGAVPFFFIRKMPRKWLGISYAIAAGLMLGASFDLVYEGLGYGYWKSVGGVFLGFIFIIISQKMVERLGEDVQFENLPRADVSKVLLFWGL